MPAVDERRTYIPVSDFYSTAGSTSPGVAENPPSLERTDIGCPAWGDMPLWEQLRFLARRTEWLRLPLYLAQESTGSDAWMVFPVAETPSETPAPTLTASTPSLQEQIAAIRSALSLQMKELAQAVGVERPTVYSWLNDRNTPHAANRERLQALYRIAQKWKRLSPAPLGSLLHEADAQGVSIFSLLTQTPVPLPVLDARLAEAARRVALQTPARGFSVRELAEKHGIDLRSVADRQDEIDLETGKRLLAE